MGRAGAPSLHALMAGLVDYAGLFPPAGLSMARAVGEYASYLQSDDRWMLGRFVVPVARLDELAAESGAHLRAAREPWRLSVLAGDDVAADVRAVRAFQDAHGGAFTVDAVEAKTPTAGAIERAAREVDGMAELYCEIPYADDPSPLLHAVQRARVRAKARTGGTTADAFPDARALARFIVRCAELRVPFKATAGLHHPLRAEHALTYEPGAPRGTMFGFLNVFVAAALAAEGAGESEVVALLEEREASAFAFGDDGLRWRDRLVPLQTLREVRTSLAIGFGSCSFREPVDDLHSLSLL